MSEAGLRSSQVAEAAGVNRETLRYYERRGLLAEPERSLGGHRIYPPEAVTVLRVIKAAQRLGFTLDEVAELLEAGGHCHRTGADAGLQRRAAAKLVEVESRIADLTAIRTTLLDALAAGCDDLVTCAASDCCPLPFVGLAAPGLVDTHHHDRGAGHPPRAIAQSGSAERATCCDETIRRRRFGQRPGQVATAVRAR